MRAHAQKQPHSQQQLGLNIRRSSGKSLATSHTVHTVLDLQRTIGNQAVQRLLHANAEGLEMGSDTSATTRFAHDFCRIKIHSNASLSLQAKLTVNAPGDTYEQEADRISEHVMRMPEPQLQRPCSCGGECPNCHTETPAQGPARLQTKHVGSGDLGKTTVPPSVHEVLRSPGQSLAPEVRAFMEPRFGHDFSRVRVHSDAAAAQSARGVSASAYTVGHNIVFGAGAFAPGTGEGRRLIAHELAHVVQQTSASAGVALQRDVPKNQPQVAPQDFAVLMSPDPNFVTLTTVIAPSATILRATSLDDLVTQLEAIKVPIGTLYFVAHMTAEGDLMFTAPGKKAGDEILTYEPAERIASKIKGSAQVERIDFRGCSIAQAPAEMDKIRVSLNATKATGSTCTLVTQSTKPILSGGKEITRPEQLKDPTVKADFVAGRKKVRELFLDKKKNCIINDTVDGYFQTGGKLIAAWVNPESMADPTGWDDTKSICYRDLKVEKLDPTKKLPVIGPDDCKLVELGKKKRP